MGHRPFPHYPKERLSFPPAVATHIGALRPLRGATQGAGEVPGADRGPLRGLPRDQAAAAG